MTTRFSEEIAKVTQAAELIQEKLGLLQRLDEIDQELGLETEAAVAKPKVEPKAVKQPQAAPPKAETKAVDGEKRKPGRPPKAKAPQAEGVDAAPRKRGRPKGSTKAVIAAANGEDVKGTDLPSLLQTIAQEEQKPLELADLVKLARQHGYTTKSKDFSNMVYQSTQKLVKQGVFVKDENRAYKYVGNNAA